MAGSIADPLSAYCCLKTVGVFSAQQFQGAPGPIPKVLWLPLGSGPGTLFAVLGSRLTKTTISIFPDLCHPPQVRLQVLSSLPGISG